MLKLGLKLKGDFVMDKAMYEKLNLHIFEKEELKKAVVLIDKSATYLVVIIYAFVLMSLAVSKNSFFLPSVILPLISYFTVSAIRKIKNFPRPFDDANVTPIIKQKNGQGFPSRHVASAFIISYVTAVFNPFLGALAMLFAFLLCITRVLSGVHYIYQVIGGAAVSIIIFTSYVLLF